MSTGSFASVIADAHIRATRRAENQEPLPNVPVGTVPDELRPYWIESDQQEMRALVTWQDRNPGSTREQRDELLHRLRLRRAVDARAAAERKQEHAVAMRLASRCEACGDPSLRVQLVDRESVLYTPEPGQSVSLPGGPPLRCCTRCQVVLPHRLALTLAAEQTGTRTRGDLADDVIRQRLASRKQQ